MPTHLSYDPRAGRRLLRRDPAMGALIERVGAFELRLSRSRSHFAYLQRAIVYQQLSGAAAATIYRRFLALFGGRPPSEAELLAVSTARLRKVGLSRPKIGYMRDLAGQLHRRDVSFRALGRLDDDAVIERVTRIKGIGVWSAQMLLMFRLGRPDVLADTDLGIRKAVGRLLRSKTLPSPERVQRRATPWAPYRSMACWYLWRSLDIETPSV